MLSVLCSVLYAERHYAEHCYAECHYAERRGGKKMLLECFVLIFFPFSILAPNFDRSSVDFGSDLVQVIEIVVNLEKEP